MFQSLGEIGMSHSSDNTLVGSEYTMPTITAQRLERMRLMSGLCVS